MVPNGRRTTLRKAIRHASHTRSDSDNLVVRCLLDDGTVGYGEGVPRDYVTGETLEKSLTMLEATDLTGQLPACRSFLPIHNHRSSLRKGFTRESVIPATWS